MQARAALLAGWLAQAVPEPDERLWVLLSITAIGAAGGILGGIASIASGRRQARTEQRAAGRDDTRLAVDVYKDLVANLRVEVTARDETIAELRDEMAGKDGEIAALREEVERCREREGSPPAAPRPRQRRGRA